MYQSSTRLRCLDFIDQNHKRTRSGGLDSGSRWFDVSDEEMKKEKAQVAERIPVGHIGQPDEIAGIMICLASDASSYLTGETIIVDGGILLA